MQYYIFTFNFLSSYIFDQTARDCSKSFGSHAIIFHLARDLFGPWRRHGIKCPHEMKLQFECEKWSAACRDYLLASVWGFVIVVFTRQQNFYLSIIFCELQFIYSHAVTQSKVAVLVSIITILP